jgi:23S rRNA (uracil1939-C5)-methyltransferase
MRYIVDTTIVVTIDALDEQGRGLATQPSGRALTIPRAAPGDVVRAHVLATSQHSALDHGALVEVISRGPSFTEPPCPHAAPDACGGCPLMHLSAAAQRDLKLSLITRALASYRVASPAPSWHPSPDTLAYRSRVHLIAARDEHEALMLGAYAPRSHRVVPMRGCLVARPPLGALIPTLEATLADVPIHPQPGGLRSITLRATSDASRWLIDLVCSPDPTWLPPIAASLLTLDGCAGVSWSPHDRDDSNALRVAPSLNALNPDAPLPKLPEALGPLTIDYAAADFSQLNALVAAAMYQAAAAHITQHAPAATIIWDLYCGAGGLGLNASLALNASPRLFGAEVHEEPLHTARALAHLHALEARFEACDLGAHIPQGWPPPDVVVVNPPRRGLDEPVLAALEAMQSRPLLIYMSCHPRSFARDAARLTRAGWKINTLSSHDMLPQTAHVELLAALTR